MYALCLITKVYCRAEVGMRFFIDEEMIHKKDPKRVKCGLKKMRTKNKGPPIFVSPYRALVCDTWIDFWLTYAYHVGDC